MTTKAAAPTANAKAPTRSADKVAAASKAPTRTAPTKAAPATKPAAKVPAKTAAKAAAPAASKPASNRYGIPQLVEGVREILPLVASCTTDRVVRAVFQAMTEAYASGKIVNIPDFGKLEIKHRPARKGRNPATGAEIDIPAKTVPKFTFAKKMKDAVNT